MSQLGTLGPVFPVQVAAATKTLATFMANKRWRLLGGVLSAGAAGATFTIESASGVDAAAIIGPMTLAANENFVLNTSDIGYGDTRLGQQMHFKLTAGAVYGTLLVQLID
jgi:hypothetical protein